MFSSQLAQSLKSYEHFSDLGVKNALDHRHIDFFRVKRIEQSTASERTTRLRPTLRAAGDVHKVGRWQNAGLSSKHETLAQCRVRLTHRLRRWPNTNPTSGQRLVFAGLFINWNLLMEVGINSVE